MSPLRIVQMIDASGWVAVYDVGSGEVKQLLTRPLVCWALIEEQAAEDGSPRPAPPARRIVGLDAEQVADMTGRAGRSGPAGSPSRPPAFLGYARDGDNLARFR